MQETWIWSLGGKDPLEKEMATTPVFLPGNPMNRGAWWATICGVAKVGHDLDLTTKTVVSLFSDTHVLSSRKIQ